MADKSLEVKITADVTSLQAKSAVAKAEYQSLASELRKTATQYAQASEEMKASLNPALEKTAQAAAMAKVELASLNEELKTSLHPEVDSFFGKISKTFFEAGDRAEGMTNKLTAATSVLSKFSEVVAVGFGGEIIAEQIKSVGELGEAYEHMQSQTGASLVQLGGLKLAAMETGTDFAMLGNGLRELGTKMQDALVHPSSEASQAFKALDVSITDSSGHIRPVVDVFADISKAMAGYQDGAAKTALAGDVLGQRFGSGLIPVMDSVGSGFDALQNKGVALGVTMSETQVQAAAAFMKSMQDSQGALIGLRNEIVTSNMPAFTALAQEFVTNAQEGGVLRDAAVALEYGLKGVLDATVAVVTGLSEVADGANFVGQVFGDTVVAAWALEQALTGNFAVAKAAVKVATTDIANDWTDMLSKMSAQEKLFSTTDSALWNNTPGPGVIAQPDASNKVAAPQLAPKVSIGSGAERIGGEKSLQDQVTQIDQDAAEARKQISTSEYDAQVSNWESLVDQGKMTKAQEIQDEEAAQNRMYQVDLEEAQKAAALLKSGTAEKAKALDDIQVLQAQHNATMAQLNTQLVSAQIEQAKQLAEKQKEAADASSAAWQKAFAPLTQAFDTSINGVLQGTETLKQAEMKAAQSITLAFIDAEAKKLEAFMVSELQILAAKAGFAATGKAMDAATSAATIENNAATAATGAYAAMAGIPYVGPFVAPVAAATAYAGVMAFDVLSASGGLALGPGMNPVVQLHENETVLPAYLSRPLTAMLTSGGDNNSVGDTHVTNNFNMTAKGGSKGSSPDDVLSALNAAVRSGSLQSYPALARMMRR